MNLPNNKWTIVLLAGLAMTVGLACQATAAVTTREITQVPLRKQTAVPVKTATPVPTARVEAAPLKLVTNSSDELQAEPQAVLNRRIPELLGSSSDPVEFFNLYMEEMVEKEAITFKDGMKSWTPFPDMPPVPNSFLSGYSIYTANERLISLRLEFSTYVTGAAHPYSYVRTVNYDLQTGQPVFLDEVFKPGVDFLAFLSDFCRKDLHARGIAPLFEEGLTPTPDNFRSWVLTSEGLWIDFDPYQVAAYAVGPQHILVPFDQMDGMLADDGPVSWLDAPEIEVETMEVPPLWPTPSPTPQE